MGNRCNAGIHDPRIAYENEDHVQVHLGEFPEKTLKSDAHVDWVSKTKISELDNSNPFNFLSSELLASFNDFSDIICNNGAAADPRAGGRRVLTFQQRLQIAVAFDKDRSAHFKNGCFRYKATHKVYGMHACMILQTKHFILSPTGQMVEIFKTNNGIRKRTITVREIAFAQEQDSNHRSHSSLPRPALWFDIPEHKLEVCSTEECKRLKRFNDKNARSGVTRLSFMECHTKHLMRRVKFHDVNNVLLSEPPFFVYYTRECHFGLPNFITALLQFKVSEIEGSISSSIKKKDLETQFNSIKRALERDQWPSHRDSLLLESRNLHVSNANGTYNPPPQKQEEKKILWDRFVKDMDISLVGVPSRKLNRKTRLRAMPTLLPGDELNQV